MNQVNPFTGAVAVSPQVQRQQAADKDRHLRRALDKTRNAALTTDQFEHQVENPEAIQPVHEEKDREPPRKRQPNGTKRGAGSERAPDSPEGEPPHLDLTA